MSEVTASRNEIVGISDKGLTLQINGREVVAAWSAILAVSAVMALVDRTSEQRMPVLVFEIMAEADERTFIVGECEPMWEPLASGLSDFLPTIPSMKIWRAVLAASGKTTLYDRAAGPFDKSV